MDAAAIARAYFDAWNSRDPAAVTAAFAPGGIYTDPNVSHGLDPAATGEYAAGLFAMYSDLAFEIEWEGACGDDAVAARWLMTGTNDGPMVGLPPTGRAVRLAGADVITVADCRVASVHGYFDTAAIPRQLGLQVVVQPAAIGPFSFGVSTYAARSRAEPGAVSLTVLEARSPAEIEEIRATSREIIAGLLATEGFISWVGAVIGDRMYTITAWESVEAVARLRDNPAHAAGMKRFFATPGVARGGQTGVWSPERLNGLWARCAVCDRMTLPGDACACPEPTRPELSYW